MVPTNDLAELQTCKPQYKEVSNISVNYVQNVVYQSTISCMENAKTF